MPRYINVFEYTTGEQIFGLTAYTRSFADYQLRKARDIVGVRPVYRLVVTPKGKEVPAYGD